MAFPKLAESERNDSTVDLPFKLKSLAIFVILWKLLIWTVSTASVIPSTPALNGSVRSCSESILPFVTFRFQVTKELPKPNEGSVADHSISVRVPCSFQTGFHFYPFPKSLLDLLCC